MYIKQAWTIEETVQAYSNTAHLYNQILIRR